MSKVGTYDEGAYKQHLQCIRLQSHSTSKTDLQRERRLAKKLAEGYDGHVRKDAQQREGEDNATFALRTAKNAKALEYNRERLKQIQDGAWQPRVKKTKEKIRIEKTEYQRARRAAKRKEQQQGA